MKIKRFFMEDWLIDTQNVKYNLGESGCQDFTLEEFLNICDTDIEEFHHIFLGNNDTRGSLGLRKEICNSYQNVDMEHLMVANGTSEALFAFFNILLNKGDEVVCHFPAFQCLYQVPISIGCDMKFLDLSECENGRPDMEKLEHAVTPRTKLIIINTPHNPFGWTLSDEEMLRIADIAKTNDAFLLFDEHYRYLPLREGTDILPSGYDICKPHHDKTYATGSMIKCFGIVGIRIGWLIGGPEILAECRDYKDYLTHTIPGITDYVAYLSLKHREKLIRNKKQDILPNLRALNEFMDQNKDIFEYAPPTGGVVCFPKLKNSMSSENFCKNLLKEYQVSLLPGFAFEMEGYVRMNFGVNAEKFSQALELMQEYVSNLRLS
ncbi:MAG: hypothetical protein DRI57_00570 [Deltaproteobacteria bacterium]|nr:MAG: hypothetical protein DRI57_00570 [Deltaproteobacteria bacterium]